MASVNKVILVGNLGKDPEVRAFQSGGRVASFSVATGQSWKDKTTGERKEKVEWHRVKIFNDQLVGVAEKYLKKGSKVYLEGALETSKYADKTTGEDRYTTEVVLRPYNGTIVMLDSKKAEGGEYSDQEYQQVNETQPTGQTFAAAGNNDMDDTIPF